MRKVRVASLVLVAASLGTACWTRDDTGTGSATTDAAAPPGDGSLADARQYNLSRINALRAMNNAPPLQLDDALDAFSQAASTELSQDHQPHQYFSDHFSSCNCGVMAENQGDQNGWTAAPVHDQIDQILDLMMSEGPGGGHHDNILNPQSTKLGVGIVNPGGAMYFTNDFGR